MVKIIITNTEIKNAIIIKKCRNIRKYVAVNIQNNITFISENVFHTSWSFDTFFSFDFSSKRVW